ncbi:hypothetical protein KAI78_04645 [bacterium]|nr:hypothetical protein [bacterium]
MMKINLATKLSLLWFPFAAYIYTTISVYFQLRDNIYSIKIMKPKIVYKEENEVYNIDISLNAKNKSFHSVQLKSWEISTDKGKIHNPSPKKLWFSGDVQDFSFSIAPPKSDIKNINLCHHHIEKFEVLSSEIIIITIFYNESKKIKKVNNPISQEILNILPKYRQMFDELLAEEKNIARHM